jgi:hypothetical protein
MLLETSPFLLQQAIGALCGTEGEPSITKTAGAADFISFFDIGHSFRFVKVVLWEVNERRPVDQGMFTVFLTLPTDPTLTEHVQSANYVRTELPVRCVCSNFLELVSKLTTI